LSGRSPGPVDGKYVEVRLLEALVEAGLAPEYLERGLHKAPWGRRFKPGRHF